MPLDMPSLPLPDPAVPSSSPPRGASGREPAAALSPEILQARFMRAGPGALQSHELLALLLRGTHAPARATTVARALLSTFRSLPHVLAASREQLETVPGLGKEGACTIKLVESLGIVLAAAQLPDEIHPDLSTYDKVVAYCRARLGFKSVEELHLLFLDNRNHVIRAERSQVGTVNHTPAYPREIVHRALQLHASAIILAHNHPSTDPTPSAADIEVTRRIADAARLFDIRVLDHIIVTPTSVTSFRSQGRL